MKFINVEQTTDMMISVCQSIIKNKPYLTEVDSKIGDGDHGIGMSKGMENAMNILRNKRPFSDINQILKFTGTSMLTSMGGASGIIFGSIFLGGIKDLECVSQLDKRILEKIMRKSLDTVKEKGKAKIGDKTMIDAFEPAVIAIEKCTESDLIPVFDSAATAAEKGVQDTKQYIAKFGKAQYLGERAVGFQDAGATSIAIILRAMSDYVNTL